MANEKQREREREEQSKRWPADVEGEGRQAAADQDVGPESTPSRAGHGPAEKTKD